MVALKLLYGLCGQRGAPPEGVPPPPSDWLAWAEAAYERVASPCDYPLSVDQARPAAARLRHFVHEEAHQTGRIPLRQHD